MSRWKSSLMLLAVVGASLAQTSDSSVTPAVQRTGSKLACLCGGCRNTVANCPMLACHYSVPARERINKMTADGQSDEQIVQAFVRETGLQALAVPPSQGFNRLIWIMPWVMVALGLLGIGWFVRRHTARRVAAPAEVQPEVLSRYRDNIERDLSDLE